MEAVKTTIRLPEALNRKVDAVCKEDTIEKNKFFAIAAQMYLDQKATNAPGSLIPEHSRQQTMAGVADYAHKTNIPINQHLSTISISLTAATLMLSDRLGLSEAEAREYWIQAIEITKQNNRVLRFDEVVK